jgi:spore coat protein U-like protein
MNTISTKSFRGISFAAVAALIAGAAYAPQANAATATTTFAVTAAVSQTCLVVATPLAFGTYDPTSATPTDGTTTVTVTCTTATPYNVGLSAGGGTGATVASRKMTSGSNLLNYTLYQTAAHTTVWGQTVGTDTIAGTATGLPIAYTVYGRIPAQQSVGSGAYTDTITVTVTY